MSAQPIRVSRGGTYVPEWGNEDREEAEKIRIHYRFLSFAEQQEELHTDDLGRNFAYESRVLARMIGKVENLAVEDDAGVREIKIGADIVAEPALDKLALELWMRFRSMTAVDKKKSPLGSSSGQAAKQASESDLKSETDG